MLTESNNHHAEDAERVESNEQKALSLSLPTRKHHNVWYRNFLKPFIRKEHKPRSYKQSFQKRVVHATGIPVAEIEGLHALFKAEYRHYSPLYGMIFTYNHFVNNLYRYGDQDSEPAVALVRELFHILPGGEIQPTHAGRNAGAHLSSGLVGRILETYEDFRVHFADDSDLDTVQQKLAEALAEVIRSDADYQTDAQKLQDQVRSAEAALVELQRQEDEAAPVRQRIRELEGDVIKANRHQIKRLRKELKKANEDEARASQIEAEIQSLLAQNEQVEAELKELRSRVVTSLAFKVARKNLRRAQEAVEQEAEDRLHLASILAASFGTNELPTQVPSSLPQFSTTAILLSFLWRKYDSIRALEGYFRSMSRMGALEVPLENVLNLLQTDRSASPHETEATTPSSVQHNNRKQHAPHALVPHRLWSAADIETATTITTGASDNAHRPPIVQFSYVTWAAYSEFPDCGETALRNLFNQLVYNPDTGKFDAQLLRDLRDNGHYPNLSDKLIAFYQKHPNPQDSTNSAVAVDWIDVVSNLNDYRGWTKDHGKMWIKYRRETEEQNIASPLRNALQVVNALLGVETVAGSELVQQLVQHINALRHLDLQVDLTGVKDDGFGTLALTAGDVRYELQSYKPVHFGFVQAEMDASSRGHSGGDHHHHHQRGDFRAFRRLMRHSSHVPAGHMSSESSEYFQQLALASLFVPFHLRRQAIGPFFRHAAPRHYPLLFADWESETHHQEALQWAQKRDDAPSDAQVRALVHRAESYVEPEFAPSRKNDKETAVVQKE